MNKIFHKIFFYLWLCVAIAGLSVIMIGLIFPSHQMLIWGGVYFLSIGILWMIAETLHMKRAESKKVRFGVESIFAGVICILASFVSEGDFKFFIISFAAGILAIIFAIISFKEGKAKYGLIGGMCGITGLIISSYLWW
ncbi:MAG: hypothetical protein DRN29_07100 [Thermoplasmata archaeon]|nr:MAG: hypothetical protein DRN29_07100 [Thermoplasmata archaeon]